MVECILASRRYRRRLEYRVKWVGFEHDPGWYPSEFFEHAQEKVQEFHAEHPNSPRPWVLPHPQAAPASAAPPQQFIGVHVPPPRQAVPQAPAPALLPNPPGPHPPEVRHSRRVAGLPASLQLP